jgi:hypothetical protein
MWSVQLQPTEQIVLVILQSSARCPKEKKECLSALVFSKLNFEEKEPS